MAKYNYQDLRKVFESFSGSATVSASLSSELVGGMSADRAGIEAFVQHHLKLKGQEAEDAVARIMKEEIGERDVPFIGDGKQEPDKEEKTKGEAEMKESLTYGVNVVRRDVNGPYLGNWMIKACLKAAASRVGLFMAKKGTKGDMAEMGLVEPHGQSRMTDQFDMQRVYLRDACGNNAAETYFSQFKGRVNTPTGAKSIVNDAECVAPGSTFGFRFFWHDGKLKEEDMVKIFAAAMVIGLGSAKALERGKFRILELEIDNVRVKEDRVKKINEEAAEQEAVVA